MPTSIQRLKTRLTGDVLLPGSSEFAACVSLDNGRIKRRPAAIVRPRSVRDIQTTIAFAQNACLPVAIKAGGHSYAGYCLNEAGLVVDLRQMQRIRFADDEETLVVEMGALWSDVYNYLRAAGSELLAIGGTCLSVGVAGFILGGGYSFLSRSYGLGSDNVKSLTIVLADRQVRTVSADAELTSDRELFWACLGAGGGNFGIVVEVTLQLHKPRSPRILGGTLLYPFHRANEVIAFYQTWAPTLPHSLSVYGYIGNLADPSRPGAPRMMLRLQPVYNGRFEDGLALLAPLLALSPLHTEFFDVPFLEYLTICDKTTDIGGRCSYTRSGMVDKRGLTPAVATVIQHFMASAPSRESFMLWMHQGGKTASRGLDASPFPHRETAYVLEIVAVWRDPADMRQNVDWACNFAAALTPHCTGAYINYIDPLLLDWPTMYYGSHYATLQRIKKLHDPTNFFHFQQSIGSHYRPSETQPRDLTPLQRTNLVL